MVRLGTPSHPPAEAIKLSRRSSGGRGRKGGLRSRSHATSTRPSGPRVRARGRHVPASHQLVLFSHTGSTDTGGGQTVTSRDPIGRSPRSLSLTTGRAAVPTAGRSRTRRPATPGREQAQPDARHRSERLGAGEHKDTRRECDEDQQRDEVENSIAGGRHLRRVVCEGSPLSRGRSGLFDFIHAPSRPAPPAMPHTARTNPVKLDRRRPSPRGVAQRANTHLCTVVFGEIRSCSATSVLR